MSNIFYLMGKSSSGKDTLYRKLMEQNRLLKGIVSYTTRPQRAGETDGKEYFFAVNLYSSDGATGAKAYNKALEILNYMGIY